MTVRYIRLPTTYGEASPPYAEALAFLAWTAWPAPNANKHRDRFFYGGLATLAKAGRTPWPERPVKLRYVKPQRFETKASRAEKIIREQRWRAFSMASWQSAEPIPDYPDYPLSLNEAAKQLADWGSDHPDEAEANKLRNEQNIRSRIWSPSLPALALTFGLFQAVGLMEQRRLSGIGELIREPDWLPEAVAVATAIADEIQQRFDPPELIVPVLAEPVLVAAR